MAEKTATYKSRYPQFSIARSIQGKSAPIHFSPHGRKPHGEFSTDDPEIRKFIESHATFKNGTVCLKSQAESDEEAKELEAEKKKHAPAMAKQREYYEKAHAKRVADRSLSEKHHQASLAANQKDHQTAVTKGHAIKHKPHLETKPTPAAPAAPTAPTAPEQK